MEINESRISCFVKAQCTLGEGPIWDTSRNGLWWVDIVGQRIYFVAAQGYPLQSWPMPELTGFVLPRPDGQLWVGLKSGLHLATLPDDTQTPTLQRLNHIDTDQPDIRFNDATLDAQGNLYAATMDMQTQRPLGKVFRYEVADNGQLSPAITLASDFIVANGPALSPDGQTLYMIESSGHPGRAKGVWRATIQPDGTLSEETPWLEWPYDGSPDGGTVDADGNLWLGNYGGDTIRQFSADGQLLTSIPLPVVNPTKVAVHPDGTLFVTSAREGALDQQLADYPLTGSVLKISLR